MKNVSFYLLADAHYVSKKNWTEGKPFTFRERSDQIALKATPEILDTFIEKIIVHERVKSEGKTILKIEFVFRGIGKLELGKLKT